MAWRDYISQNPDAVQERLNIDRDVHDPGFGPEQDAYVGRLGRLSQFLKSQIPPNIPGSYDVYHRFMNYSGLIGGESNFSKSPYEWYDPTATMESITPLVKEGRVHPDTEGGVYSFNPERIYISPEIEKSFASSLIAHEGGGHAGSEKLSNRFQGEMIKNAKTANYAKYAWKPLFTLEFQDELLKLREKQTSPYYKAGGFGSRPDETMAYFMGREAELPAGKTLKDDPSTAPVFAKHPGMYDEYIRSRDKIRSVYRKR